MSPFTFTCCIALGIALGNFLTCWILFWIKKALGVNLSPLSTRITFQWPAPSFPPFGTEPPCRRAKVKIQRERPARPTKPWSKKHSWCVKCGTIESPHHARGHCHSCYQVVFYPKSRRR